MKLQNLALAKKISIAGYGAEGKAAESFCKTHCPAIPREIVDPISSPVSDDGGVWIVSPGIPRKFFKNIPNERVTAGTEIFFDSLTEEERARVIGISGTKGKSTTTKFCVEVLSAAGKKAIGVGNYGVPLLDVFDAFREGKYDFVVAELSSYQLENLEVSPGLVLFLNIFPDHLDRHGSFDAYQKAKSNLWAHQKKGDMLFVSEVLDGRFKTESDVYKATALSADVFPVDSPFRGTHWCQNFGVVEKMCKTLELPYSAITQTASKFSGLPHRLQHFSSVENRMWWDDSICTNPEAAVATVKFFGNALGALIVGGQDRGMDVSILAKALSKYAPEALVVILESEVTGRFQSAIPNAICVSNFEEVISLVLKNTSEQTNIVLCPAAPSYDSFKNFEEKGDAFQKSVRSALG